MRRMLIAVVTAALLLPHAGAAADIEDTCPEAPGCSTVQEGDNDGHTDQHGAAASGDAVAGQVVGGVSAGRLSVDARNRSVDADVSSGDASASNGISSFTGLNVASGTGKVSIGSPAQVADIEGVVSLSLQEGDNSFTGDQTVEATSGDAVAGQVVGAVTSVGGSAEIVADNVSEDADVGTGDAAADNAIAAFVGSNFVTGDSPVNSVVASDLTNIVAGANVQEGDNDLVARQSSNASTGDGVAGQVIGAVSAGATSIDARNRSTDVDVDTGGADAGGSAALITGQNDVFGTTATNVVSADLTFVFAGNAQEGDNSSDVGQSATAASGDGVGGQVIGAVTAAGGSASIVADNGSDDVDAETGDASATNELAGIVGQNIVSTVLSSGPASNTVGTSDVTTAFASNLQEGDNDLAADQDADASSGDVVGGQVIGGVSAGDTSIDARNRSTDVDLESGTADASNEEAEFVGEHLQLAATVTSVIATDITDAEGFLIQEGDNEVESSQQSSASSGDAVGGEVIGVVTSAGGSADVVADNTSEDVDVVTGDAFASADGAGLTGLNLMFGGSGPASSTVGTSDISDAIAFNIQEGDNSLSRDQSVAATSGDGVGGQVIGVVSAGETSVDARNVSEDADIETGTATGAVGAAAQVGLSNVQGFGAETSVGASDVTDSFGDNIQSGDNEANDVQEANAFTGDAVGGQVVGSVVPAGGLAEYVVDNRSIDVDAESGDSDRSDESAVFVGVSFSNGPLVLG